MTRTLPWLAMAAVLAGSVYQLRSQGRLWRCSCDYVLLWTNEHWGHDTSHSTSMETTSQSSYATGTLGTTNATSPQSTNP